ncbi:MAG TPA: RsmD family RNA methyltransferase [Anaerolineae bacterium]|nr:RsmD family RNA methyltransferase [Anaerolineae bacterium]
MPEAGRVVTGSAGGLRLEAPGPGTRPLPDKVKQALFSMLEAEREDAWDRPMLDLFAGSGAAGIEALSRGAPAAVLVEKDGRAAAVIGRNLERTDLARGARIVRRDVSAFLARRADAPEAPFGCVVLDPPYQQTADLLAALERLGDPAGDWLDGAAVVVAKHFWRDAPPDRCGTLRRVRLRRFGETALSVYRQEP